MYNADMLEKWMIPVLNKLGQQSMRLHLVTQSKLKCKLMDVFIPETFHALLTAIRSASHVHKNT